MLQETDIKQCPILIVDDEPANVALLTRILQRAGYTKISSTTAPTQATKLYGELQPDLLLLDLNMPKMDGFAVMQALQSQFPDKDHNIIVVTALDGRSVRREALEAGAKDFITKPIDRTELIVRIRNHLQTHALYSHLEQQNTELAKANESLEVLNQSMSDLVSIVSHELRTPLTAIKSFAEILREDHDNLKKDERNHFLSIIDNESDRLSRLISDLLDLQKIESGKMHWATEKIDLAQVTRDTVEFFSPSYANKGLSLELDMSLDEAMVITDPDKLRQVITNLFSNALKFTDQGGVTVQLTQNDQWAKILLLSNNETAIKHTVETAQSLNAQVITLSEPNQVIEHLNQTGEQVDLLIIDNQTSYSTGAGVIEQVWDQLPALPVITINDGQPAAAGTPPKDHLISQITELVCLPPTHTMYELSISDTGHGIPREQLSKVFERFHQVDTSQTREQRGTGLGLTICQQIVHHYHGKVWVESEYGKGSTFHLLLPAVQEGKKRLGEILIEKGLVTQQQLTDALKDQ
ncbi:MAG TPA: hybrid sensor histidine kinase/response regulator [Gammaproteobacteria bacterium]|nr:hybrid sensor histidine kinase/response regulator [Gammaproteobacteria bacterium]